MIKYNQIESTLWKTTEALSLSAESIKMLFENKIPLVRIEKFATPQECEALVTQANLLGFDVYQNVTPKIERIGITVFEYNNIGKEDYFQAVERARKEQYRITSASFNPLERLMATMQNQTGRTVRIASESSWGSYHAGLTRKIEEGTQLHIDYAPTEQLGWEVSKVVAQLAWNLYLQISLNDSGKTYIYDRQWHPGDETYKLDSYGYNNAVVSGASSLNFQPQVGDVYIFNTRNYHTVEPIKGQRVTFTSAIGLLPNDEIIFWS
ncbi:hypothetical protein [Floridanema aerugineum]|uniref:Prolyl 4-hydroxylase alpha subunit Fe(2+) 2OG dioxygenase domain-containing protein n=1 Tax=Floridaenema aerugineum BLCC-F46 TaxID=3153654 RepID=A0ABV4X9L0_9CYAN